MPQASRVLCCRRVGLASPALLHTQSSTGLQSATGSFLERPGWDVFRNVVEGLRRACPAAKPVVVRTAWLPRTTLGECVRRPQRFVVRLNIGMDQNTAVETLCHEWAHAVSWNYALDELLKRLSIDPVEFDLASHDEAWGCAYSRVWRAYVGICGSGAG
jgi:hypothetical protein